MSRKINYKTASPFHDRLWGLLGKNTQKWAEKLGISKGTITNVWLKGSYPGADKIIKICEVTGVSADWLLSGKGSEPCLVNCSPEMQEWCRKVMLVIQSETNWAEILKLAIDSCAESVIAQRKITNTGKTHSSGFASDTPKEPAESTGSKKKAG